MFPFMLLFVGQEVLGNMLGAERFFTVRRGIPTLVSDWDAQLRPTVGLIAFWYFGLLAVWRIASGNVSTLDQAVSASCSAFFARSPRSLAISPGQPWTSK